MGSRTKYNEWVFETFNVFPFFVSTPWTTSTLAPSNILHSSSHIYPLHIVFTNIFIIELVIKLKKLLVHGLMVQSVAEPQSNRWRYKYIIYILIKLKIIYIYIYIYIYIIFKCENIQNERKIDYQILINFIILENIISFLFDIINLFRNTYIFFICHFN